jgi:hypothetical protein
VLAQLQSAWDARGDIDPEIWRAEAQRLKRLRDDLNGYVERLHWRHVNGMTIYEAIGWVVDGDDVPALGLSWSSATAHNARAMEAMRDVVDRLEVNAQAVGYGALLSNPLACVGQSDWSPTWQKSLIDAARNAIPVVRAVEEAYERFSQLTGLPRRALARRVRNAVGVLARTLPHAAGRDWRFVLRADARSIVERLKLGVQLLTEHRALSSQLSCAWPDSIVVACE